MWFGIHLGPFSIGTHTRATKRRQRNDTPTDPKTLLIVAALFLSGWAITLAGPYGIPIATLIMTITVYNMRVYARRKRERRPPTGR